MDFYKFFLRGTLRLPIDIWELIFGYIPTTHLWAYRNINEHAIRVLNVRKVQITLGKDLYKLGAHDYKIGEQWGMIPTGDETLLGRFSDHEKVVLSSSKMLTA